MFLYKFIQTQLEQKKKDFQKLSNEEREKTKKKIHKEINLIMKETSFAPT